MIDFGLLALRSAGFLLAFTFGIQKIGWYIAAFHSNAPFASVGLAPLIAKMDFPASVILALWITFNESIYTSVQLGEDWLRAALYLIVFIAFSLMGAGKFSIDWQWQARKTKSVSSKN